MSWNIRHYHALLYLKGVPDQEQLDNIVSQYAEQLLRDLRSSSSLQEELGCLDIDYDIDDHELLSCLNAAIKSFIKEVEFTERYTFVLIESEYDSENYCDEFVDYLARLFFPYSVDPYILLFCSSLDRTGAYGSQSVLYLHDNKFIQKNASEFLEAIFKQPSSKLHSILSAIQEV